MSESSSFECYRPLLFSIAYRMLGSAMEAEDIVQEAYLRYQDAHDVRSVKSYLTTVVTHLCLDHLKSAQTQRVNYIGTWLPEPVLTSELPSAIVGKHESISMAFLVLLENLSPLERAIFILRDVFDYRYAEIATIVDKSEANCRQYYRRAKRFLMERKPRYEPSSEEQDKLVEGFLTAVTTGDLEVLTHMLAEDVTLHGDGGGKAMAVRRPLVGREGVSRFLLLGIYRLLPADAQVQIVEVNGAPSALFWGKDILYFVMNLTVTNGKVRSIRNVLNPDKLAYIQQHNQPDRGSHEESC